MINCLNSFIRKIFCTQKYKWIFRKSLEGQMQKKKKSNWIKIFNHLKFYKLSFLIREKINIKEPSFFVKQIKQFFYRKVFYLTIWFKIVENCWKISIPASTLRFNSFKKSALALKNIHSLTFLKSFVTQILCYQSYRDDNHLNDIYI